MHLIKIFFMCIKKENRNAFFLVSPIKDGVREDLEILFPGLGI